MRTALDGIARIVAITLDKEELKALWWWIKWILFWGLVLLIFGVPCFLFF
jgi:hypothetical protein